MTASQLTSGHQDMKLLDAPAAQTDHRDRPPISISPTDAPFPVAQSTSLINNVHIPGPAGLPAAHLSDDMSTLLYQMRSTNTDDAASINSDVSMASQWTFDIEDDHSDPPHGAYLPPPPSTASALNMPPLPRGYSFLDDLNDASDVDLSAYDSFGSLAGSRRSSLSAMSSDSHLSTSPTYSTVVPSVANIEAGIQGVGDRQFLLPPIMQQPANLGSNLANDPPLSFVRDNQITSNVLPALPPAALQTIVSPPSESTAAGIPSVSTTSVAPSIPAVVNAMHSVPAPINTTHVPVSAPHAAVPATLNATVDGIQVIPTSNRPEVHAEVLHAGAVLPPSE